MFMYSAFIYIYIYICMCMYMCIYIIRQRGIFWDGGGGKKSNNYQLNVPK